MQKIKRNSYYHFDNAFRLNPMQLELFELEQIGEQCLESGNSTTIPDHVQTCQEISYVISGSGYFIQGTNRVRVAPGDLIINCKGTCHSIAADEQEALRFTYVAFNFREDRFPDEQIMQCFKNPLQVVCRDQNDIYSFFRKGLDEFYQDVMGSSLIVEACMLQIATWTCRYMTAAEHNPTYRSARSPSALIIAIENYVDSHISEPLTVVSIANALGYSNCYLSHQFREHTGKTLQEHIISCKIWHAKRLIALNRYSFNQIAGKLGYQNIQSFNRVFKKKTGMTPSAYLKIL